MIINTHGNLARDRVRDTGNHVLPESLVVLGSVFGLLSVAIRITARYRIERLAIPDILLVISLVNHPSPVTIPSRPTDFQPKAFYIGHAYNAYQAAIYPGIGIHEWEYSTELAATSHYSVKFGSIFFGLNIVFLKIAILLDWMHIFVPKTRNALYYIFTVLIWTNALLYSVGTLVEIFQCMLKDIGTKRCKIDIAKFTVVSGIINIISDLTILITPHWVVWKLNMSTIRKVGVSVLFLMGVLAVGGAITRVIYVYTAFHSGDQSFYCMGINLSALAELTFGYLVIGTTLKYDEQLLEARIKIDELHAEKKSRPFRS
ncbi:hypothetical protein F4802DRAFT_592744 [Xylaria palmicola]|nr:hypothetical protein F4802DRAFT_592744 [Xylaria palmicola]